MCGIGLVWRGESTFSSADFRRLIAAVAHRGPDGEGACYLHDAGGSWRTTSDDDPRWRLALGHRRLSILDLSDAGRQPMARGDRLWITYNGEIYNFVELRAELERCGEVFHSGSDTEVILAAYSRWGTDCFAKFRGMWALAIADLEAGRLIVSRDRLGMKPLYVHQSPQLLAIVSEIKQLSGIDQFRLTANREVLREYLLTGYESLEQTFFNDVRPLAPGCWQAIDLRDGSRGPAESYWNPERITDDVGDIDEAAARLRDVLSRSMELHLRSDVRVGCALSGGLDSSAVPALIGQCDPSLNPLETFTVSFPGHRLDERQFATLAMTVTRYRAHFIEPTAEGFLADLDRFVWIHDEPVGTVAQYAAYALARSARAAGVPVVLSGQGGDEILAGYWQSYFSYLYGRLRSRHAPNALGHFIGALLPGGNSELVRQIPVMWRRYRSRSRAAEFSALPSLRDHNGATGNRLQRILDARGTARRILEIRELYLPRLLKWDDRNYMAFSVEGRFPFLDHEVIETALSFRDSVLYSRGWIKEPLRRALSSRLPREIVRRRGKFGFEVPQDDWVRGALRPMLESWLNDDSPLWEFVERGEVRSLCEQVWSAGGKREELGQIVMRLFFADRWLRTFFT